MSEPIHERPHLRDRREDWADASDTEWIDALGSQARPVDPMFIEKPPAYPSEGDPSL